MAKAQGFRKRERLPGRADFARVYQKRQIASDAILTVYVAHNELSWTRLGISTSRRVGNAVKRAFIRRRIREAFRRNKEQLPKGMDLVCVAKIGAGERSADVTASLIALAKRAARACN